MEFGWTRPVGFFGGLIGFGEGRKQQAGDENEKKDLNVLKYNSALLEIVSDKLYYFAESPDELCLCASAAAMGLAFSGRDAARVHVGEYSKSFFAGVYDRSYEVLQVLEFDSTRKRMSVVARMGDAGELWLLTKGADTAILGLCGFEGDEASKAAADVLHFARKGWRTLCFARRKVSDAEFEMWSIAYRRAVNAVEETPDGNAKDDAEKRVKTLVSALETGDWHEYGYVPHSAE